MSSRLSQDAVRSTFGNINSCWRLMLGLTVYPLETFLKCDPLLESTLAASHSVCALRLWTSLLLAKTESMTAFLRLKAGSLDLLASGLGSPGYLLCRNVTRGVLGLRGGKCNWGLFTCLLRRPSRRGPNVRRSCCPDGFGEFPVLHVIPRPAPTRRKIFFLPKLDDVLTWSLSLTYTRVR